MSYNTSIYNHITQLEYNKFVELVNESRFPPTTAVRIYPPHEVGMLPITATEIYSKWANIAVIANVEDLGTSGQNGVFVVDPSNGNLTGSFTTLTVLSTCRIQGISASGGTSNLTNLTKYDLPVNFTLNAPITAIQLSYGVASLYRR